jgi:hypothetical protein
METIDAKAILELNGNHVSKRKSNANHTDNQQNNASTTTTINLFEVLDSPRRNDAA